MYRLSRRKNWRWVDSPSWAMTAKPISRRPPERGGGIEAHHPGVADEGALPSAEAESAVDLGAEAQRHRALAPAERDHREVFPHRDLGLGLLAELAVPAAGGEDSAGQAMHPRGGLGQLEALHVGEDASLRGGRDRRAQEHEAAQQAPRSTA